MVNSRTNQANVEGRDGERSNMFGTDSSKGMETGENATYCNDTEPFMSCFHVLTIGTKYYVKPSTYEEAKIIWQSLKTDYNNYIMIVKSLFVYYKESIQTSLLSSQIDKYKNIAMKMQIIFLKCKPFYNEIKLFLI